MRKISRMGTDRVGEEASREKRTAGELDARADALRGLRDEQVPCLVAGAYAFFEYTGIFRDTKDLDLFVRAGDLEGAFRVLEPAGFRVARARTPLKLLAVRTGLAQYGRNNITYVRGMGSFADLNAFCTDAPLQAEDYRTKGSWRLSCCPPCRNCHHVCPTGCIPYDGKVIDAERCLTYLNEHEEAFPQWLDAGSHNALVGCMRCQEMCPANRVYLRIPKVVAEFDHEETAWVLRGLPADQLPEGVREKLRRLDMEGYSTVIGRNLQALAAAEKNRSSTQPDPRDPSGL